MNRRSTSVVWLAVVAAMLVGVPVLAQQPYPPPPPDGDGGSPRVVFNCEVEDRTIHCHGEAWADNSTVTIQIHAQGGPSAAAPLATIGLVAQGGPRLITAYTVQTDDEGDFDTDFDLGCEVDSSGVRITASGKDSNGRPARETQRENIAPPPDSCRDAAGAVASAGVTKPLGSSDSAGIAGLPVTGRDLAILLAAVLLLLNLGAVLVRMRNERATG